MLCLSINPEKSSRLYFRRERNGLTLESVLEVLRINSDNSLVVNFGQQRLILQEGRQSSVMFADAVVVIHHTVKNARRVKLKVEAPMTVDIIREKLIKGTAQ